MTTELTNVTDYLRWHVKSRKMLGMPRNEACRYQSYEELVLDTGRLFGPVLDLPDGVERGPMKNCYENALTAAANHEGDENGNPTLFYTEGYAASTRVGFPVMHAWLTDAEGNVYDPTWTEGGEYFGIAFDNSWAIEASIALGYYGLLANDWLSEDPFVIDGFPDEAFAFGE
jgi:hypothetical protein